MPFSADYPSVAVVILTCNQKDITLQCLESLAECDYSNKQVVLVDNGSTDGVEEEVKQKFPDVAVLRNEKNLGASGGRNAGISYAREHLDFQYILFMDNDIIVQPDFLGKLVEGLRSCQDSRVEIASPMIYQMGKKKIIDIAGGARVNFNTGSTQTRGHDEEDRGQYDDDPFPGCVPTTAVLLHRRALERAGGYDVAFDPYGYEDLDMILRANQAGHPILFVPRAVVHHKGSYTGFSGYTAQYTRLKGRNLRLFLHRHASAFQWICFNLLLPLLGMRTIVREVRRGNVRAIIGLAKGFLSGGK